MRWITSILLIALVWLLGILAAPYAQYHSMLDAWNTFEQLPPNSELIAGGFFSLLALYLLLGMLHENKLPPYVTMIQGATSDNQRKVSDLIEAFKGFKSDVNLQIGSLAASQEGLTKTINEVIAKTFDKEWLEKAVERMRKMPVPDQHITQTQQLTEASLKAHYNLLHEQFQSAVEAMRAAITYDNLVYALNEQSERIEGGLKKYDAKAHEQAQVIIEILADGVLERLLFLSNIADKTGDRFRKFKEKLNEETEGEEA